MIEYIQLYPFVKTVLELGNGFLGITSNTQVECMAWPNECYTDLHVHLQIVEIVNKLTYTKSQQ